MDDQSFDLEKYLTCGVESIVKGALKASLIHPRESVFMTRYAHSAKKATQRRHEAEERGEHIPPFLIASITSSCNLHCAGCYSRAIDSCSDTAPTEQLDGPTWGMLFRESADLGIAFVFLAGGEPLLRRDVLEEAAAVPEILFPVITNGTMLRGDCLSLFDRHRNLVPVLSVEGGRETTDRRRGHGIYAALDRVMASLKDAGILFGVSVTVTTENLQEVMSREFVDDLYQKGCRLMIYVEYVPAEQGTDSLAPGDAERARMGEQLSLLRGANRGTNENMVFVSFPGDEATSGGCLAAGRGFFHINSRGGAEPCPFAPRSDVNVRDVGIAGTLRSGLFQALRESGLQAELHNGGCALFDRDAEILALMDSSRL